MDSWLLVVGGSLSLSGMVTPALTGGRGGLTGEGSGAGETDAAGTSLALRDEDRTAGMLAASRRQGVRGDCETLDEKENL